MPYILNDARLQLSHTYHIVLNDSLPPTPSHTPYIPTYIVYILNLNVLNSPLRYALATAPHAIKHVAKWLPTRGLAWRKGSSSST